jgi:hypothetical protein
VVSLLLMLARVTRDGDANSDALDDQILDACRREVLDILESAELTLWELEDAGWSAPEDDSSLAYAARLLFCCDRLADLGSAVALAREITLRKTIKPAAEGEPAAHGVWAGRLLDGRRRG